MGFFLWKECTFGCIKQSKKKPKPTGTTTARTNSTTKTTSKTTATTTHTHTSVWVDCPHSILQRNWRLWDEKHSEGTHAPLISFKRWTQSQAFLEPHDFKGQNSKRKKNIRQYWWIVKLKNLPLFVKSSISDCKGLYIQVGSIFIAYDLYALTYGLFIAQHLQGPEAE